MKLDRAITEDMSERLSAHLGEHLGLNFPRERWSELERGLRSAARDFDFNNPTSCAEWLLSSPLSRCQVEVLAGHFTVGETYFFREKGAFKAFEERILPALIQSKQDEGGRLRFWSAGCATGEEPYSIAMELDRILGPEASRKASILATDINPRSLAKAAGGVYGEWSFREAPQDAKERYFRKRERGHEILPAIRKRVTFSYLNLAEDAYPSLANNTNALDVIFCRNVLMYFSPRQARKVIQKFHRSLVEGGWLIVSPCEASAELFSNFAGVHFPGVILYRKTSPECVRDFDPIPAPTPEFVVPQEQPDCSSSREWGEGSAAPSVELLIQQAVEPPPPAGPSRLDLARERYAEGRYADVIDILDGAADADQDSAALALMARAHANQGRLAEALAQCERAIERDKVHAGNHFLRATILIEQGARDEARQELKRTLYLDPDFALAHLALANLARQQQDARSSERHFRIVRRLLSARPRDEVLPESEGMTAGRLLEIIDAQPGAPRGNRTGLVAQRRDAAHHLPTARSRSRSK